MEYPEEWDEFPKREKKKKIKQLKREKERKAETVKKARNILGAIAIVALLVVGYRLVTKKTPEQIEFEQKVEEVSLEGKVEEFPIEGESHIGAGQSATYQTNPPTSGSHYAQSANWGFYDKGVSDEQLVHNLEHGGIWISYKDLSEEEIEKLKNIVKKNSGSVIVSNRPENDDTVAIASWGRMMRLIEVDEALIQKYVDTYKNQSPEKLAR